MGEPGDGGPPSLLSRITEGGGSWFLAPLIIEGDSLDLSGFFNDKQQRPSLAGVSTEGNCLERCGVALRIKGKSPRKRIQLWPFYIPREEM